MADPVWGEIELALGQIAALPHNVVRLKARGLTPSDEVASKLLEIKSGLLGAPRREQWIGPKMFLRVVGAGNRAYSGEWWFDAEVLAALDDAYARISLEQDDLNQVVRDMLRELLAISHEWNSITEIWELRLPAGERLVGYGGIGSPQQLFANLPLTEKGNRMLVGRARQYFFPVKNPLWVEKIRNLV